MSPDYNYSKINNDTNSGGIDGGKTSVTITLTEVLPPSRTYFAFFFYLAILLSCYLPSSPVSAITSANTSNTNVVKNGLVGHWTFDGKNMTNATATDSSGNGKNGALVSMTTASAKRIGKIGQGLAFNGSTDYINVGAGFYTITKTTPFSGAVWIKSSLSSQQVIISNWNYFTSPGWFFGSAHCGNGSLIGIALTDAISANFTGICGVTPVRDGKWHHVAFTYDGSNTTAGMKIYIDGRLDVSTVRGNLDPGTLVDNALVIGRSVASFPFNGSMDDMRMYSRVLTAQEIQSLYKAGGGLAQIISPTNGLKMQLTFDSKNTNNSTTSDISGNRNDGKLYNLSTANLTNGTLNQALTFNGTSSWIAVPGIGSSRFTNATFTFTGWFKTGTSTAGLISQDYCNGGILISATTRLNVLMRQNGSCGPGGASRSSNSTTMLSNTWHHYAAVITTNTSSSTQNFITIYVDGVLDQGALSQSGVYGQAVENYLTIGSRYSGTEYLLNGQMDDTRYYDRGLTATEVAGLYKAGIKKLVDVKQAVSNTNNVGINSGLVGYWTFDGKNMTNATATDTSGSGNNGTLTNMTATSSKTIGKLGQALKLDGLDDHIIAGNNTSINITSNLSVSTWLKPGVSTFGNSQYVISKYDGNGLLQYLLFINASGTIASFFTGSGNADNAASASIPQNKWSHIVGIWDGTNVKIYVNGVFITNAATPVAPVLSGTNLLFGKREGFGDRNLNGSIDDVRIYNRTLSPSEVKSLYKLGAQ